MVGGEAGVAVLQHERETMNLCELHEGASNILFVLLKVHQEAEAPRREMNGAMSKQKNGT